MYYDGRYYDVGTGQFISADPIEYDTENTYRYVGNNPTNMTDSTGLNPNQFDVKSKTEIIELIEGLEDKFKQDEGRYPTTIEALKLFSQYQEEKNAGPLYVFVEGEEDAWVDMFHFANTARGAYYASAPVAKLGGVGVEIWQYMNLTGYRITGKCDLRDNAASANGVEDYLSNALGADFGAFVRKIPDKLRLSGVLQSRLNASEDPQSKESFHGLPHTEMEWQRWRLDKGGPALTMRDGAAVSLEQIRRAATARAIGEEKARLKAAAPELERQDNIKLLRDALADSHDARLTTVAHLKSRVNLLRTSIETKKYAIKVLSGESYIPELKARVAEYEVELAELEALITAHGE